MNNTLKSFLVVLISLIAFWILLPLGVVEVGNYFMPYTVQIPKPLGILITVSGFLFAMISSLYLMVDGGGFPISFYKPPRKLVKCGPYSMCRHPIYLGFLIYLLGVSFIRSNLGSIIASLIFSIFTILWAVFFEERKLLEKFGGKYEKYREEVPAFIPRFPKRFENCPTLLFLTLYVIGHLIVPFVWRIKVEKNCDVPEEGVIFVSNHVTFLDFALLIYAVKRFMNFPVSYIQYMWNEWFFRTVGTFPIKRHEVDVGAIRKTLKIISDGGRIGIFPESERSWDGRFLGFKKGVEKLLERAPKPLIGVRIEKFHLLFPRWSGFFHRGRIEVVVKCFESVRELEKFLEPPSVDPDDVYKDYRGIERYIYLCPECGTVASIRSTKDTIFCEKCGFHMKRPTVGELWKVHDEIRKRIPLHITDKVEELDSLGKKPVKEVIMRFERDRILVGEREIPVTEIKSVLLEGRDKMFLFTGEEILGFRLKRTSILMWKELIEDITRLKRSRPERSD